MMKNKIFFMLMLLITTACQDQLDIVNPNKPTPESARTEQGIISLAQGAVYINGFQETKFGGNFFPFVLGFHDRMGDIVSSPFNFHFLSCPDNIILDDGRNLNSINLTGQKGFLREANIPSSQANPQYYEWAFMYSLNGALNNVLANIEQVGMRDASKNTIRAWAYFWKGFAYSRIGSMYYAGIINDQPNKTSNSYVSKEEILVEAENNFGKAEALLLSLQGDANYYKVMQVLIPTVCQKGKGGTLSAEEWVRNINTMRARNLLVNTRIGSMSSGVWEKVLSWTTNGVKKSDKTFTIRTDDLGNLLSGHVALSALGPAVDGGGGYKISERFIQDFKPGDLRFTNNFDQISPWIAEADRGTSLNTRYLLIDKGRGIPGVVAMCDQAIGADELYIAGSYEENILMLAEARIYQGNIESGLDLIDELRTYQGAGLAQVSGTGLAMDQAKEELRRERRIALAFRGFSFYDARRWGVLEYGRTGSVVVDFNGNVNTNATIDYGYMDYWDVPVAEWFYNPPSSGSAPIVNTD